MNGVRAGVAAAIVAMLCAVPARAGVATDEMIRCAALGPKHPGMASTNQMGDRLIEAFRGAGLEVHAEPFHMPVWEAGPVSLKIAEGPGAGTAYAAESFAYGAPRTVTAEVVDLGTGGESDYDGKDVDGKIAMVNRSDTFHRTVQIEIARRHGAVAMLLVAGSPDNMIQTGSVRWGQRPPSSIPAVTIGNTDGGALRAQMEQGPVTLEVAVEGRRVDKVARNIVGVRKGTRHPDRYVIVAGHYDSWYAGAFDNCTAVGSLLHMVEELKDEAPAYTTYFIGWDAEEPGLVGSYDWIARHQDLIPKTVLNVNLEETASALFYGGEKLDTPSPQLAGTTSSPTLAATVVATGATSLHTPVFGPIAALRGLSGGIIPTDIEGFYAQGVQGVTTAGLSPYYHTTGDTEDKINADDLEKISAWLTNLVRNVQAVPPDALAYREVPVVKLTVPPEAAAGAAVPVDIEVTGTDGEPVTGVRPLVLADQRHNWAVAEGYAEELGGGRYRYTLPAGATDAFVTRLRATITTDEYLANGFARVDQRRGGLLSRGNVCVRPKVVRLRATEPVVAKGRRGRVKVRGRVVSVDLRKAGPGLFKLQVTSADGRRQKRVFRPCA